MKTLCLKPAAPDSIVRDPDTMRPLPPEGAEVRDQPIWHRRLGRGEVVKTTEAEIAAGKAQREAAEADAAASDAPTDVPAVEAATGKRAKSTTTTAPKE